MNSYFASVGHKPETEADMQLVPPGEYFTPRLPYGGEFTDRHGMHDRRQPDSYVVQDWRTDERSGLLWPATDGVACVELNVHLEAGGYREIRDRFVRWVPKTGGGWTEDPTATDHRPPSDGLQCFTKQHWLLVNRRTPICIRIAHDDTVPRRLVMVQFKMLILA